MRCVVPSVAGRMSSGAGVPDANTAVGVDLLDACADDFVTCSQVTLDDSSLRLVAKYLHGNRLDGVVVEDSPNHGLGVSIRNRTHRDACTFVAGLEQMNGCCQSDCKVGGWIDKLEPSIVGSRKWISDRG